MITRLLPLALLLGCEDPPGEDAEDETLCGGQEGSPEGAVPCDDPKYDPGAGAIEAFEPSCGPSSPAPHPDLAARCAEGVAAFSEAESFSTLQSGISASPPILYVCPGVHAEALHAADRDVTLAAASGSAEDTILDGEGQRPILQAGYGDLTLYNLTLRGGYSPYSGGAIDGGEGELAVRCSRLEGNRAGYEGGGIAWSEGGVLVEYSELVDNSAGHSGGAIDCAGTSSCAVANSTVAWNSAGFQGGALDCGGPCAVTDSAFTANSSGDSGGALYASGGSAGDVLVEGSLFVDNRAGGHAGALYASGSLEIRGSSFTDNVSDNNAGALAFAGSAVIEDSAFAGNAAAADGGAVWLDGAFAVAFERVTFDGNGAGVGGAALGAGDGSAGSSITLIDSLVTRNDAYLYGAVDLRSGVSFSSEGTGWGEGDADNAAYDLSGSCGTFDDLGDEAFSCP